MDDSSAAVDVASKETFASEAMLVAAAVTFLKSGRDLWGIVGFGLEFDYRRGRPDIVGVSGQGDVIAIEAKLRNWREALHQAYRNTCFAVESYILMPARAAHRAAAFDAEFDRRGVGICTISDIGFEVVHPARRHDDPLEPWLTKRAAAFASSAGN